MEQEATFSSDEEQTPMSRFIMVRRGHCSNPTKVRNIENFGGALALIADYYEEDMSDVIMTDYGGAGQSLITPAFMIDYKSSQLIEDAVKSGKEVIMRASLTIGKPDDQMKIGLLYSSTLDLNSESMNSFADLAWESVKNRHKPILDLHIHTFACPSCPQAIKESNCVSDGNYCAFFPKAGTAAQ